MLVRPAMKSLFCLKAKKRPRSLRSLGLASVYVGRAMYVPWAHWYDRGEPVAGWFVRRFARPALIIKGDIVREGRGNQTIART